MRIHNQPECGAALLLLLRTLRTTAAQPASCRGSSPQSDWQRRCAMNRQPAARCVTPRRALRLGLDGGSDDSATSEHELQRRNDSSLSSYRNR